MKKFRIFFGIFLSWTLSYAQDSLVVTTHDDTVLVRHVNAHALCGVKFMFDVSVAAGTITIIERDTSVGHFQCWCGPKDLSVAMTGLQSGEYVVQVFRQELTKYHYDADTTYFMCSAAFSFENPDSSCFSYRGSQSGCGVQEVQNGITVYFNSFESLQDTVGWEGYLAFNSDVPLEGGKQSVHISGGCIWPHAWIELPPLETGGFFVLGCWGKNLQIGGSVSIDAGGGIGERASIFVDEKEWKFYQSAETLYSSAGKRIRLSMGAGGIAASAMLIDRVEIVSVEHVDMPTEVQEEAPVNSFALHQNYPNPFNPTTNIGYRILTTEFVSLKVFDMLGREVATLVNEQQSPGVYNVQWNATGFASGMYFYRMQTGKFSETKKLILTK